MWGAVISVCQAWLECPDAAFICGAVVLTKGWRNGFLSPVLKHGPRSLTYVRVQGTNSPVRNESDSGWIPQGLHSPPAPIPRETGLSVSTHVETRKMVNYARVG
jgi:hypothetical protein